MNSSSMREDSASAWPCLVTTVPRTSDTISSSRTRGRQREDRQPAAVGLGEHLAGHGRGALGAAVGERGGAHRVQPLDQGPAVGGVGRWEPGAEDDEDVGAGGGERVGGVVDDHVPDDPAEAGGAGGDGRARADPGSCEGLLDGETHPFLPAGAVVPTWSRPATRRQPNYAGTESEPLRCVEAASEASPWVTTHPPPLSSSRLPHPAILSGVPGRRPPFLATSAIRGRATRRIGSNPGPPRPAGW